MNLSQKCILLKIKSALDVEEEDDEDIDENISSLF
jgi:hypothetical protein